MSKSETSSLEKLKALIEKSKKQKVDLRSFKPIKKRENLLKEDNKLNLSCLIFLLLAMYGTFKQSFLTEKVSFLITFTRHFYKGLNFSAGFQVQKMLKNFSENLMTAIFVKELSLVSEYPILPLTSSKKNMHIMEML